ncbi:LINE-1 reverse transcriptase homolog [Elysia marginata]|uniref:LINE-1 reverse transcriptase homolog n=1 Tax=Elysia marginata TaxID=1093978 RepID=A0AAV4ENC8_9GAST|nr:LINE-1 reverse transcriptase homolog [Elysia marginata]
MKAEVKAVSQQFSKFLQTKKRNNLSLVRLNLEDLSEELSKDPTNEELQAKWIENKKKLEVIEFGKTKGAQFRAGIKWAKEGERNTKYFLNLERSRSQGNTIYSLKSDEGTIINTPQEVLIEISKYYRSLYKEDKNRQNISRETRNFTNNLPVPNFSDQEKGICEAELSEQETLAALKSMKNGSSPGSDRFPAEFYKVFWADIKDMFMHCIIFSFNTGSLSPTQC